MSYIDTQIITMRKNNSYIRTILDWVVKQNPMLDEQICLAGILRVLDENNMAVSRNEVRKAFTKYYHKDFHGDKVSYINWLCKEFHVKTGTLVNSSNIRSQASKKRAISCISEAKKGVESNKNKEMTTSKGLGTQESLGALNTTKQQLEEGFDV